MRLEDVAIYDEFETDFTHNGDILIDFQEEPVINRVINGRFVFSGVYPLGKQFSEKIKEGAIIKAMTPTGVKQLFRIGNITGKTLLSISFTANHIGFDANRNFIEKMFVSSGTVNQIMKEIKNSLAFSQRFEYSSTMTGTHQFTIIKNYPVDAMIGSNNQAQNLAGVVSGELDMDNFNFTMKERLGEDRGFPVDMGLNLDSITETVSGELCPNSLFLEGATEEGDYDEERDPISLAFVEPKDMVVTDTNRIIGKYTNSECKTQDELRTWAEKDLFGKQQIHLPKVMHEVKIIDIAMTEEYKDYKDLFTLQIGDTVHCRLQTQDIIIQERMIEYNFYPRIKAYKDMILGNDIGMYTRTVKSVVNETFREINETKQHALSDLLNASEVITGNQGGHVIHWPKNRPSDIGIMDTDNIETAKHVLRMNKSGIGFSKNGWDGPYLTAWTIDGVFNADFIRAGTLKAITIEGVEIFGSLFETFNEVATQLIQINAGRLAFMLNEKDENGNRKVIGDLNPIFSSDAAGIAFNVEEGNVLSIGMNPTATAGGQYVLRIPETSTNANPLLQLKGRIDLDGELYIGGQKVTPGGTGGGGGGWNGQYPPELTTDMQKRAWQVYQMALGFGYTKQAAAGLLGNMQQESNISPTASENSSPGYGYGLVQWTDSSGTSTGRNYMLGLMNKAGITDDPDSITAQMKLVEWHSQNGQWIATSAYPYSYSQFKELTDIQTATMAFLRNFERAGVEAAGNRVQWANDWYNLFKDLKNPGTGDYALPVREGTPVTSWFGPRWGTMHNGIDFGAPSGDPIFASKDGTVVQSMPTSASGGFGEYIIIQHDDGYMSGYAHMTTRMKQVGDVVSQGQQIGTCGSTGDSTGPHLHFSIQTGTWGPYVDPAPFLGLTPP